MGKTQNAKESLTKECKRGLIWQRCPKKQISGRKTVEIAAASAVIHFKDGPLVINNVFSRPRISKGCYCLTGSAKKDRKRKRSIKVKSSEKSKKEENSSEH